MSYRSRNETVENLKELRWPLFLTEAGLWAECFWKAFWPLFSVLFAAIGFLMLGLHDIVNVEIVWGFAVLSVLGTLGTALWGAFRYRVPGRAEALARLDQNIPGRPIQAMMDQQVIGSGDPASAGVWRAHQARMTDQARKARPVAGDLRVARHDPYGLRFVAGLLFAVALLFGSVSRVGTIVDVAPSVEVADSGPVWEGWVEPPRYTGQPSLYLDDIDGQLTVPKGSYVTLRLYGAVDELTVDETVSGRIGAMPDPTGPKQDFVIQQDGMIAIAGPGGRTFEVSILPDEQPSVMLAGIPDSDAYGETTLPFIARDDYGVEAGEAIVRLDLASVDRRHGLTPLPDARPDLIVPLPMPIAGSRREFSENLIYDFSEHPWANLPVTVSLSVLDAAEQNGVSEPRAMTLPGRRFFDPLAAALIEQRRDLLWARANGKRVSQILRAVSHLPQDVFRKETDRMRMRRIIERMELYVRYGIEEEQQEALAQDLWDLAIIIEEGDLASALERLRQAQERLEQAMRDGASQAEIEELMRELRQATDDYMRQLSRQAQLDAEQNQEQSPGDAQQQQNQMMLSQDDIQRMMDRIQELMEQGRMAEAEQAMRELQELLENLQMQQAQGGGQGGESPGEQAMEGLAETLREQQGLSDQAFRDLQEQFNPNAQSGQSQGNEGREGGEGRGQEHSQTPGEGGQQGEGTQQGQQGQQPNGNQQSQEGAPSSPGQSLADRQQALRDELRRQQQSLPGAGTSEGQAAREALDRAGRAMENAEDALRGRDYSEAIDQQSKAMDALREGMQALQEQMAQQQQNQQGQGQAQMDGQAPGQDPLGRSTNNGGMPGDERLGTLPGQADLQGQARRLLDEIQRRSTENARTAQEREYLKRLLDRF